ncbi:amidohydrolase family protein [Haloarculaceae archaeon H-GB2-1]|nr:amidohydrolase family protein [Haloarculaceae archaeon H-GB1-1]MEA5409397.1 amidohydrolase family protein [Haloarculaceae archaeon H-GB2-1]
MVEGRSLEETSAFEASTVIDTDVHIAGVNDPAYMKAVSRRLEEPFKSRFDPDVDTFANVYPTLGHGEVFPSEVHDEVGKVTDPSDIDRGLCDRFGVDVPIVHNLYMLDAGVDMERYGPEMRAHNDVFIEQFLDDQDDVYGTATIGVNKPEETVEEIERMANESKIAGLMIHTGGQERALGDPRYDRVYAAAEDNDLPIVFHSTGSSLIWGGAGFSRGMKKHVTHHVLSQTWSQMLTLVTVVTEGVPEKFPELEFVMLGPGIDWVPYLMGRTNREWHQRRTESPMVKKLPEKYVRDQFYFGTQPLSEFNNTEFTRDLIDIVGADSLMYGSDYPHYDMDSPDAFDEAFSHLSADERDQILSGNAGDVFDIPV